LKQPLRLIVVTQGDLSLNHKVFTTLTDAPTCVITSSNANQSWLNELKKRGVDIIIVPEIKPHYLDINAILQELGRRNITSLLVEGGMTLHQSFMQTQHANKVITYITNVIIGDMPKKQRIHIENYQQMQEDICVTAYLH
jgi:diaminohydroxyphosphoribosylaminopyrimidine deaminase/5-amino-6-(5-phosphoribosylamino)uracil reductase